MSLSKELRYRSSTHDDIERGIWDRLTASGSTMSKFWPRMAEAEELYTAYMPETDEDAVRRSDRKDKGLPRYTTIQVPYSYAILLTAHTYFTSVFLARNPIFQFTARHGEVRENEQAIEALIDYQINVGDNLVPLYIWLLDPGKYGFGVVGVYWDEETIISRSIVEEQETFLGIPIPGKTKKVAKVIEVPGYTGNRLYNVRPQDWFPDTRLPLHRFQKGEFVGRYVEIGWDEILAGERSGKYINIDVLRLNPDERYSKFGGEPTRDTGGRNSTLPGVEDEFSWQKYDTKNTYGFVRGHEFYWKLIPSEMGLGKGDRIETWVFTRTVGGVLIEARPLGCYHGKFPFAVIETEADGYNILPPSMLSNLKPLNDTMSWLFNTHFFNVRAALNNQFIYDPSMLVEDDIKNPRAGKLIRLRPSAYGRDVRTLISQLPVGDVTRAHLEDVSMVEEMMQRMPGVTDNIMGMVNSTRKTATEVRQSSTFGINRLKSQCEFMSAMGFSPLAQMMLQQSQQYYDAVRKYKIVGDLSFDQRQFVDVSPENIAGFYDFVPVDGTMPVDRFALSNVWQALLGQLQNYPQILMTYDITKIFAYIAGLAGLKNLGQFKLQVTPDQQLAMAAQAGNVVPMKGKMPMAPGMENRVPQVQTPGMGQAV